MGNVTQEAPARLLAVMSPGCGVLGSSAASTGTCSSHSVSAGGWVQGRAWGRSVDRLHRLTLPDKGICSRDRELLFLHYLWRALQRSIGPLFLSCPLLLLLQESLPSERSAFPTWLGSTRAQRPGAGRVLTEQISGRRAQELSREGRDILLSQWRYSLWS